MKKLYKAIRKVNMKTKPLILSFFIMTLLLSIQIASASSPEINYTKRNDTSDTVTGTYTEAFIRDLINQDPYTMDWLKEMWGGIFSQPMTFVVLIFFIIVAYSLIYRKRQQPKKKKDKSFYRWLILADLLPIIGAFIIKRMEISDKHLKDFCIKLSFYNPWLLIELLSIVAGIAEIYVLSIFPFAIYGFLTRVFVLISTGLLITYMVLTNVLKTNKYRNFYPIFWFSIIGAAYAYNKEKRVGVRKRVVYVFLTNIVAHTLRQILILVLLVLGASIVSVLF